jgi:hypothetical protein
VRYLPPNKQQEALLLLNSLANEPGSEPKRAVDRRSIWEIVEEVNAGLPVDTWENIPTDGSINLDHYLDGAQKQQP